MPAFDRLISAVQRHGTAFLPLVDPEKTTPERADAFGAACSSAGVDGILVGGSTMEHDTLEAVVRALKKRTDVPVVLFPGSSLQLTPAADAVLFMSLLSGRNPAYLVDHQVQGAPVIKEYGLEPIPTAYLLIDGGTVSAVQSVSETVPIAGNDIDTAKAHALCAAYFGMKLVYLEAGSGAAHPVSDAMIGAVASYTGLPVVVGGGIRTPDHAAAAAGAGASFVVVGTATEEDGADGLLAEMTKAVHSA